MQARVKEDHKWFDVKVAGHEFVKGEFQDVPEALEGAVLDHPFLDVKEGQAPAKKTKKEVAPVAPEMVEGEGTGETNTHVDGDQLTTDQTPTTPTPETPPPAPEPTAGGKKVKKVLTPEEEKAQKDLYNANRKEKRAAEKLANATSKLEAIDKKVD